MNRKMLHRQRLHNQSQPQTCQVITGCLRIHKVCSSNTVCLTLRADNRIVTPLAMLISADPVVINLTGASGTLVSPGYPDTYTKETDYVWIITVLPYKSVTLTFLDFEISCSLSTSLVVYTHSVKLLDAKNKTKKKQVCRVYKNPK